MGRADRARRERPSRRLEYRPRRAAGLDAPASSVVCGRPCRVRLALASFLLWTCLALLAVPAQAQTVVPNDWALTPTQVQAGESFRLIFASSGARQATSNQISRYNTFVQNQAAAGHNAIQAYSSGFRAVGCTATVNARDNTSTTPTGDGGGEPIFWLNGRKVANHYGDFYDGAWANQRNIKDESGNDRSLQASANRPWTGCNHNGTSRGGNLSLGAGAYAIVGNPHAGGTSNGPLSSTLGLTNTENHPMYGLSEVFRRPADDATVSALTLTEPSGLELALTPQFTSDHKAYSASTGNLTETITIAATPNDANATTLKFLDENDQELTDADSAKAGFQIALVVGGNTIKVRVSRRMLPAAIQG